MNAATSSVCGNRVLTPDGIRPALIELIGGRIAAVRLRSSPSGVSREGTVAFDAGDALVLPGFVDTHVHVNEPGRTEWEGFATATDAAAAGGVTTIVDMPLNSSPVTTTADALEVKRRAAAEKLRVDCGFWGGVVPGNEDDLSDLAEAGVLGFKCFLCDSGIDEFPRVGEAELLRAMPILSRLELPLLVHAELPASLDRAGRSVPSSSRRYADWLASRPPEAEVEAVRLLIDLVRETGCAVHVVHVSARGCLPLLDDARREGLPVSAETCPHYLTFAAGQVPDGATGLKCAPPIRDAGNREALWRGLEEGVLDLVASDHSPCPPPARAPETGDFFEAWGGIASLQLGPSVVWTGASARGHGPDSLARWMSSGPARVAGLAGRKGRIAPGYDADLVIFEPDAQFQVNPWRLRDRHRWTPYEGRALRGEVVRTYLRGRLVWADGELVGDRGGRMLARTGGPQRGDA